ncbi:hypothetical protein LSH36_662g02038 [Paralvinella palmiformis]|uniref:Uncharacterized protein n=1 Tax=Paralvinella palmiformis TaxID=53620 RepID=A0AAD9J4I0_9ANNE|nr:hypothetical protein LSH36_662g02038 [Paralvinella palmiformis]
MGRVEFAPLSGLPMSADVLGQVARYLWGLVKIKGEGSDLGLDTVGILPSCKGVSLRAYARVYERAISRISLTGTRKADLQDPDHIPAADSTPQSSGQRDGSDGMTPDRPEVEAFISDNTDEQTETAPTETEMAPLSKEPVVNEIGTLSFYGAVTPASPASTNPEPASEEVRTTNGYHGNDEAGCTETEEEKIQELMSRSDTAVIFPEPVSDHEEGNVTTENEAPLERALMTSRERSRAEPCQIAAGPISGRHLPGEMDVNVSEAEDKAPAPEIKK